MPARGFKLPPDEKRCTRIKVNGERCRQWQSDYSTECKKHSGKAGRPPTTGTSSKVVGRLRETFALAQQNKHLLRLEPAIAAYDLRCSELLDRIEQGDSPTFRKKAMELYNEYNSCLADSDMTGATKAFDALGELLRTGVGRDSAWDQFLDKQDRRASRVEKAMEISLKGEQVLNQKDLMIVLNSFINILREEVPRGSVLSVLNRIDQELMGQDQGRELAAIGSGGESTTREI